MKKVFCGVAAVSVIFLMFSCGSSPKPAPVVEQVEPEYEADPSEAVSIVLPPKKDMSFFGSVDPDAVAAVEKGSPESINQAYSILRKDSDAYTDAEKILLNAGRSIMMIMWPSEKPSFEQFNVEMLNPYSGAIDSARQGIYDESTGNSDFLTLVLPSLVLVTSNSREDYYELSKDALDKALSMRSDSVLANYLRGVLCHRLKDDGGALPYFQAAYDNAGDCVETAFALADCNYKNQNYEVALEQARRLSESNQFYKSALKLCAEACFITDRLDECEQYVARVLQQEPENSYYVLFRAKILIKKNDYIRAASLLDVYARTDAENREYLVLRTKVQKDWNKNVTAAAATIEKALSLYPDDTEIILTAASLASETGSKIGGESAGELASKILEKDSRNVKALEIKVNELVLQKNWNEAYNISSELRKLKNAPEESVYVHVMICLSSGKKDEAWNIASALYAKNPKDETVLQNYIKVLIGTGRTQEAARVISQNMAGASAKMKSFLHYEHSFLVTGEEAVLVDLRSSLTANPRNKDALFRLYQIYFNKKEYRKAQYYLKQVVALSPADENLLRLNTELETLLSK